MIASSSLAGCHALQIQSRVDPHTIATYAPGGGTRYSRKEANSEDDTEACPLVATGRDDHRGAINLDCFRFFEDRERTGRSTLAYVRALGSVRERNRLTSILIKQSDDICTIEMSQLRANEATVNTALSTVTTGFSAAASIVGGELAKSILSGVATFATGTQSHLNVQVYRNQISEAVSQAIDVERDRQRSEIFGKYKDAPDVWTVDDAVRSVNYYHSNCSFYKGLQLLLAKPGQEQALAKYMGELEKAREAQASLIDGAKPGQKAEPNPSALPEETPIKEPPLIKGKGPD